MAGTKRSAHAVWKGNLAGGSGTVRGATGAFGDQAVSWPARTEEPGGKTSPEELIAAAHAACYAMALSHTLAQAGHEPEELNVDATATFEPKQGGGFHISTMDLRVRGKVPGIDPGTFQELAKKGEQGCPVSGALRNNVAINLEASLA